MSSFLPLKRVARVRFSSVDKKSNEGEISVRLCNYTDVYYRDSISPDVAFMVATATPNQLRQFSLRRDDVLITKDSESPDDIGIPAYVSFSDPKVLCGYHLAQIRPEKERLDGKYLYWWMASDIAQEELSARANGITRFGLKLESIATAPVRLPGLPEQRAIADFLDRDTSRIDALVKKKRRLGALAQERFESVVLDAMRGAITSLDAPRKPSGLEWLGDIPEHWTTPPVGANFDVILGKMVNPEASSAADRYPYLRNTNVKWDHFDLADLETMGFSPVERVKYSLRKGDLLVCEGGEVGRAAVWDQDEPDLFFQKAVHRVRARRDASTRFLMYCFRAAAKRGVFRVEGNQATIVHLTAEKLRVHRFPWPPPTEQDLIVKRLDAERDALRLLTSRLDSQLSLLQEHRQALITAAVTGQMEIPTAA